jgi:hypothetical protein
MKESIKMEDYDGYLEKFIKVQRTKILPLRWLGNLLSIPATNSLLKAFELQEADKIGYRFKFHVLVFKFLYKPYEKWGTYYSNEGSK